MASEPLQREIDQFIANTPRSKQLQVEAAAYLPGGSSRGTAYYDPYPTFVDYGKGHDVYDVDGNRYLDFMINATSLVLGHAHPDVVQALQAQVARGTAFSGPTEAQIRLSKILCERVPSVETIRFTNSGTEGTMMAMRTARAFTGKHKIAKFEGGYHGTHEYATVSVGPPADKLDPNGPSAIPEHPGQPPSVADDVIVLPYNDLPGSQALLEQHKDDLACVMMEAVASRFGYVPADPDFLQGIRDLTRDLGILLIFDEVQSFRVGPGGAQEWFGVIPDLTTFGKIIGGGTPVGAWGGRRDIMALLDPTRGGATLAHAGTFNANPLTMVAGEVVMTHLTPEVYQRLNDLGEMLRQKLRAIFDELQVPVQITGIGSLFGIHFTDQDVTDYRSMLRGNRTLNKTLFTGLLNEHLLLQTSCAGAMTTLTTETEIDELVDGVRRVVQRIC